jgi:hypothetical protein
LQDYVCSLLTRCFIFTLRCALRFPLLVEFVVEIFNPPFLTSQAKGVDLTSARKQLTSSFSPFFTNINSTASKHAFKRPFLVDTLRGASFLLNALSFFLCHILKL